MMTINIPSCPLPLKEQTFIKKTGTTYWYYEFRCTDVLREDNPKCWICDNSGFIHDFSFLMSLLDLKFDIDITEMLRIRLRKYPFIFKFTRLFGRIQIFIYPTK